MTKILITGGAGFIGSHLAEKYVQDGNLVRVVDDFSDGNLSNIRKLLKHKNFELIRGDVRDQKLMLRATADVDVIFHLAAKVHVDRSIEDPKTTFEVNTLGTLSVLNASLRNDVKSVIYASSSEVYGSALYVPIDEKHPLNPASPYAASKAAADRLCYSYHKTYGMNVVIVRCFNTFGPRQRSGPYGAVIPKFTQRVLDGLPPIIYGDGKQTRDYLYVKDTVKAYDLVLNHVNFLRGKAINFGSGREVSIHNLAKLIIQLCGDALSNDIEPIFKSPRPGEVRRLCVDARFAKRELGFKLDYTLENGLKEFICWYKKHCH